MFVTDQMINEMAASYGSPSTPTFDIPTTLNEIKFIRSTQKNGRNHDVTIYAIKDDQVIVTAKHFYPPGLFRAPSGGLNPGESFEDGIVREMAEEIGCEIAIERFLLHNAVTFRNVEDDSDLIEWRSFVFLAKYISGDFNFTDRHEIREVKLADWSEFEKFGMIMRASDKAGLQYRAQLHEAVVVVL